MVPSHTTLQHSFQSPNKLVLSLQNICKPVRIRQPGCFSFLCWLHMSHGSAGPSWKVSSHATFDAIEKSDKRRLHLIQWL